MLLPDLGRRTFHGRRVLQSLDTANLGDRRRQGVGTRSRQEGSEQVAVDRAVDAFLDANAQLKSIHTYKQVLLPFKKFCLGKSISQFVL